MIELRVSAADLSRVRFAYSPLRETVMSLRALGTAGRAAHLHRPWRSAADTALRNLPETDLPMLTAIVRPQGYIPDFLAPPPRRHRALTFGHEMRTVDQADRTTVAAELRHVAEHRLAQQGAGREHRVRLLTRLADRHDAGLPLVAAALRRYHDAVIRPSWPRIRALLQDDIAYRLEALGAGGFDEMVRDLHPSVTFRADTLRIVKYYDGTSELGGRGLVLMPSAFAWPDVLVRTAQPNAAVSYSPRGIGRLWEQDLGEADTALADVIGRTRAALLAQLDLPMSTTQTATQLALSAPTVSVHLQALRRAGLLTSRRDGRRVLYSRSELGDLLLSGGAP